jgi:hypothetical protein
MAWDCPFNNNGICIKRKKKCEVLSKGCVLKNKLKFIEPKKNK